MKHSGGNGFALRFTATGFGDALAKISEPRRPTPTPATPMRSLAPGRVPSASAEREINVGDATPAINAAEAADLRKSRLVERIADNLLTHNGLKPENAASKSG